jgi:hypothetical protein
MTRINLFRSVTIRNTPTRSLFAWGNDNHEKSTGILVFAATLIVCSFAVGCSSEKPKTENSSNQTPIAQVTPPAPMAAPSAPAATTPAEAKPVHKKIVRRAPVTVKYEDKTSGVSFQYPRKYELKTGEAADGLVSSGLMPMDFVQPGGVVTAAIAIPEGAYPKSDLVSALFDVSVNKSLTAEQCGEFLTSQADSSTPTDGSTQATTTPSTPKLILGDMELESSEMLGSAANRKEESKYYHVFENGACYEFALKVATTGVEADEGGKPVDREEVFKKLEGILATVKISATTDMTASAPATPSVPAAATGPAQ